MGVPEIASTRIDSSMLISSWLDPRCRGNDNSYQSVDFSRKRHSSDQIFERRRLQISLIIAFSSDVSPMLQVTVALPSGRSEKLSLPSSTVGDLKVLAQKTFGQGFLRLTADGHILKDLSQPLQAGHFRVGVVAWVGPTAIETVKLGATSRAFALYFVGNDEIFTWGDENYGACGFMRLHQEDAEGFFSTMPEWFGWFGWFCRWSYRNRGTGNGIKTWAIPRYFQDEDP